MESFVSDDEEDEYETDDEEEEEEGENNKDSENDVTLPCNEKNSVENDHEINNEKGEVDKTLQKKNVLTKQQKKAQKLEKKAKQKAEQNEKLTAENKTKASLISIERLLTDEDFRKIDAALVKREVTCAKRGVKRTHDQIETEKQSGELIKLSNIENIYKKRKHDKAARLESVKVRNTQKYYSKKKLYILMCYKIPWFKHCMEFVERTGRKRKVRL